MFDRGILRSILQAIRVLQKMVDALPMRQLVIQRDRLVAALSCLAVGSWLGFLARSLCEEIKEAWHYWKPSSVSGFLPRCLEPK